MPNLNDINWYNKVFREYYEYHNPKDLPKNILKREKNLNKEIDPSNSNERLFVDSGEKKWVPSFLLSSLFSENRQKFDDLINDPQYITRLNKSVNRRGPEQDNLEYAKFLHAMMSCSITAEEAAWTYRYQRRYLFWIAQQCDKLFPFAIAHKTLKYALHWLSFATELDDTFKTFKEDLINELTKGEMTGEGFWYLILLYPFVKWQTHYYQKVMKYFRGEEEIQDETHYLEMNIMSKMMLFSPRLHRGAFVFRGTGIRTPAYREYIYKIMSEGVMKTTEYFSASRSYFIAEDFFGKTLEDESVMMILDLPQGFPAFIFDEQFEQEILIPPCIEWSVKKIASPKVYEQNGYKTKTVHYLLCTPLRTGTWGYRVPDTPEEENWFKKSIALHLGQYACYLGHKIYGQDGVPQNFPSNKDLFRFIKNDRDHFCIQSKIGISNIDKALPPPSSEFILELKNRVIKKDTRISARPPQNFPFANKMIEIEQMFHQGIPIPKTYKDILDVMSYHILHIPTRKLILNEKQDKQLQKSIYQLDSSILSLWLKNEELYRTHGSEYLKYLKESDSPHPVEWQTSWPHFLEMARERQNSSRKISKLHGGALNKRRSTRYSSRRLSRRQRKRTASRRRTRKQSSRKKTTRRR